MASPRWHEVAASCNNTNALIVFEENIYLLDAAAIRSGRSRLMGKAQHKSLLLFAERKRKSDGVLLPDTLRCSTDTGGADEEPSIQP